MIDRILLLLTLTAVAGLGTLAVASWRRRFEERHVVALFLGLLIAYAALLFWGMARRAADLERSTRTQSSTGGTGAKE
jgi:hypothetical protein